MKRLTPIAFALLVIGIMPGAQAEDNPGASLIARGQSLAVASDCAACHTNSREQGKPFAGGYGISSPMGTIYSTNITPSVSAGIGNYTEQQFSRALREGIRRDGTRLYPAMPYTAYTKFSDDEIKALYAYFMHGVAPVDTPAATHTDLPFPFSIRASMAVWNLLYLDNQRFIPDASKSREWNEGAALVQGAAHCGACHTPRNILMAEDNARFLQGAQLGPWFAPDITANNTTGIGDWSEQDIVDYLQTGRVAGRAQAAGPMAEAIEHSLQHLSREQLRAIALYLKSLSPEPGNQLASASLAHSPDVKTWDSELQLRGAYPQNATNSLTSGEALYSGYCSSCHQPDGSGSKNQAYPSLFSNTVTAANNPSNLVAAILFGVDRDAAGQHVLMPSFGEGSYVGELTDHQVAAIANYVLQKYGDPSVTVSESFVREIRNGGPKPFLALIQPWIIPGMIGAGAVIVLLILWLAFRRRHHPA